MMQTRRGTIARGSMLALLGLGACRGPAAAAPAVRDDTEQLLEQIREGSKAVALAAGIYDRNGLVKAYVRGVRKSGGTDPATAEDRWHIGSNTKAMTAALWARLVEQGVVEQGVARWDMPLTEAVQKAGLGLDVHAGWEGVTVEHLLRHRGGMLDARLINREWLNSSRTDSRSLPQQRSALARSALEAAPDGEVGSFAYGNANYIVVGAIIEGLTGQSWEEAMQAQVFAPLGMAGAGFGAPSDPAPWGHRSMMGLKLAVDPAGGLADNPAALGPAGTVHLSLDDYGRFLSAILQEGAGWLSPDSVRRLVTAKPGEDYALGWIVLPQQPWAKGAVIGHEGSNTLWHTFTAVDLGAGKAWVTASNDAAGGAAACPQAGLALARRQDV